MIMTNRCFIVGNLSKEPNVWDYHVTANGLSYGLFKVHIDKELRKKICVISFEFKSSNKDEMFENEIFKEVFGHMAKMMGLPLCFNSKVLTENTKKVLQEMGAKEVVDIDHIWPNTFNVFMLEAK